MSTTIPGNQIIPVNSTSYVDMLGILAGIDRLPGEDAATFEERLELAVSSQRGPNYSGLINSLMTELGMQTFQAISITRDDNQPFDVAVGFGVLTVSCLDETYQIALLSMTPDNFWSWAQLSDIAASINGLSGFSASLMSSDGPALQLAFQKNGDWSVDEDLSNAGRDVKLQFAGVLPETVVFNQTAPDWTLALDGQTLHFDSQPPSNLAITYQYRICPYNLIGTPVAVFGLSDPAFGTAAAGGNGTVIYQVRQYLQEIMSRDGSYWGQ